MRLWEVNNLACTNSLAGELNYALTKTLMDSNLNNLSIKIWVRYNDYDVVCFYENR